MRSFLLGASALAMLATAPGISYASSHREAPNIAGLPKLDGTDFYLFRSYEPGRSQFVTMVANYIPLQDVYGGPNFFNLEQNGYYDINIDNSGSAQPDLRFRFRFTNTSKNIPLDIGGHKVAVPFINVGPVTPADSSVQNTAETYTISLVTGTDGHQKETPITDINGSKVFTRPLDRVGDRSIPNYTAYAATFVHGIKIPGCATPGRVFVGQRAESFVVNLAETFDLLNYKHPVGEQFKASEHSDLSDKNITSLIIEAPIACMVRGSDPVIGGWTTAFQEVMDGREPPRFNQVSRLGNPLVNELVIGLPDKDKFNASKPIDDPQFINYVAFPTLPAVISGFVGGTPPSTPRVDLEQTFLTGIGPNPVLPGGLNQPAHLQHPGEEMRLNTAIAPTPFGAQNRLGVIGGDAAGYPNGRRPGDDVVDISLRVVMGKLDAIGAFKGTAPSGNTEYTDGAYVDSTAFDPAFPYLKAPIGGSPQLP